MPAYFNISLQFCRKDLYPDFTIDFQNALNRAGLPFHRGVWNGENDSLEDILCHNQRLLQNNFKLGFTEHYTHDYKQMLFISDIYSEIRGFWMNQYPKKNEYSFELLIPEDDILTGFCPLLFEPSLTDKLIAFAQQLWEFPPVTAIQTGLEENSSTVSASDIAYGTLPNITPFAVIKAKHFQQLKELWQTGQQTSEHHTTMEISKSGILLVDRNYFPKNA